MDPGALESATRALELAMPGSVHRNAPFGALTTWRVGGPAAVAVHVARSEDLAVVASALTPGVPRIVLGRGSNLLVADAGFVGVVIMLGPTFERVAIGADRVTAGGATPLPVLARQCAAAGAAGLGFYVGIPGTVGGAVRMNAGGHGRETRDVLVEATIADLDSDGLVRTRGVDELALGYRHSSLGRGAVVVGATYGVAEGDPAQLRAELREVVRWRTEHQPGGANAGSVFRNPPGDAAARLIDAECGLRGTRIGGAVISEKHANFIQADQDARAVDVWALIIDVRRLVFDRYGIVLTPEVRPMGFDAALEPLVAPPTAP